MDSGQLSQPRDDILNSAKQEVVDPLKALFGLSTPNLFAAGVALSLPLYDIPIWWVLSGAPILTYFILLGASKGYRIVPFIPLWALLFGINLIYFVADTSWLLWRLFAFACYPTIFISCLFQFEAVGRRVRKFLRQTIKQLQFVNDKIAFFDIPALEIDTDVDGLFVMRGITIELSSLTIIVHGIEVGIKLSDDMEIALQVEKVTIPLFRKVVISDVYGNLKGGAHEMTFSELADNTDDDDGDAIFISETPLLQAAMVQGDTSTAADLLNKQKKKRPKRERKMTETMTNGNAPKDSSAKEGYASMTTLSADNDEANEQYKDTLEWIETSNAINDARKAIWELEDQEDCDIDFEAQGDDEDDDVEPLDVRAAICSRLHKVPTIPHPPSRSIKVTTLQNLSPPWLRRFLHRLPMLLRLLLNPISYFHPVEISSITTAASGAWVETMLQQQIFKHYVDSELELRRIHKRIVKWLRGANFAVELPKITGLAQVPFLSAFDILAYLRFNDVLIYRTLPDDSSLKQVVRLGGADATFTLPTFLLPHHEHLLPAKASEKTMRELQQRIDDAEGRPKTKILEEKLRKMKEDEASVKIAIHVRLPAVLDQELLNFISAIARATKVADLAKEPGFIDTLNSGSVNKAFENVGKKMLVEGIVSDQWLAKLVGKVTKLLESAMGDVGYSGDIPVKLSEYRPLRNDIEQSKLLA